MLYFALKTILTAVIVVAISELAKRYSALAAALAALPLISILAMSWLYIDTKDVGKIVDLSYGIFWLVLPTLLFFIVLPMLLKTQLGFWVSMILSCSAMIVFYFIFIYFGRKVGLPI